MKLKKVSHSNEVPNYVYDGLINANEIKKSEKLNKRKALVLSNIQNGRVDLADAKEEMQLVNHGLGVFEAGDGKIWWVEGREIVRQDDTYLEEALKIAEQLKQAQMTGKKVKFIRPYRDSKTGKLYRVGDEGIATSHGEDVMRHTEWIDVKLNSGEEVKDVPKYSLKVIAQKEAEMEKELPTKITPRFLKERPKGLPEGEVAGAEPAEEIVTKLVDRLIMINDNVGQVEAKIEALRESEGYEKLKTEKVKIAEQILSKFKVEMQKSDTVIRKVQEKLLVLQSAIVKKEPTDAKKLKLVLEKYKEAEEYLNRASGQLSESFRETKVVVVEPGKSKKKAQGEDVLSGLEAALSDYTQALGLLSESIALLE